MKLFSLRNSGRFIALHFLFAAQFLAMYAASAQHGPAEPWRDATLYRDEWGTPHIYAQNLLSLGYAFGYAQAADHPEALLRAYRVVNGRAAEVWGEDWADSDALALMLGHAALARQTFPNADAVTQDLCAGFAAGANAWYAAHPDALPEWATPVRPEDPLALMHCYLMSFAPFDLPSAYSRRRPSISGNAWAVGPARTDTGETMLVINPHGFYDSAFLWYEAHVGSGLESDDWSVSGATLVGLPVMMMGHNGHLGWALTPHEADTADMYEPTPPAETNPQSFNEAGQMIEAEVLRELQILNSLRTYRVRTAGGMDERNVVYFDHNGGPTITAPNGEYYTWAVGGYKDFGALSQLHFMGRAVNLREFQTALSMHQLPTFHVTYADAAGNIFYLYNAKVGNKPDIDGVTVKDRSAPVSWRLPLPSNKSQFFWRGIVPIEQLPSLENPPAGFLQACGNPPWAATDPRGITWGEFPAWFGREPDTYRARRVRQMLSSGVKSYRDMQDMLFDDLVPFGMTAVPRILEAVSNDADWRRNARPESLELVKALQNWNYIADVSSEGMTAFQVWWTAFRSQATFGMPEEALLDTLAANDGEVRRQSLEAVDRAARLMMAEFGSVYVPWGDAHVIRRGNETHPIGGAATGYPIFLQSDWVFGERAWEANYGYAYAMAINFGEYVEAGSVLPFGNSSSPNSPNFANQLDLFRSGRLKPAWFYKDEVLPNADSARGRSFDMVARGMDAALRVESIQPVEARVTTALRPPVAIPRGLSAYSVFAEFSFEPTDARVTFEAAIRATDDVRGGRPLDSFTVFALDGERWQPIRPQEADAEKDEIFVSMSEPTVFALFGPARPGVRAPAPRPQPEPNVPPDTRPNLETTETQPTGDFPGRGARTGAIAWGRDVELRPPALDGVFRVVADKDVGARLTVSENAPRTLPGGLVAFTPYVLAELSDPSAKLSVQVDLRPPAGSIKPEDMGQLAVYACTIDSDWERLSKQTFEPEVPRFTATDSQPRIYVLLGPSSVRTARSATED